MAVAGMPFYLLSGVAEAEKLYWRMNVEEKDIVLNGLKMIEDLDVEQGILYCNGEETYIEILRAYCEEWEKNLALAKETFEKKDWKNYTIAVHGLKSALFSIGANKISGMAKQLEHAGRDNRISYIEEHHLELTEAYEEFFAGLMKKEWLFSREEAVSDETVELEQLTSLQFDKIIADMEDAVYSFDGDVLIKFVEELERYCYNGKVMKDILVPVRRKIEMSDFMSAVDFIAGWKKDSDSRDIV